RVRGVCGGDALLLSRALLQGTLLRRDPMALRQRRLDPQRLAAHAAAGLLLLATGGLGVAVAESAADLWHPGATTVAEAIRRSGPPTRDGVAYVPADRVDPFVAPPTPDSVARLTADPKAIDAEILTVRLLIWGSAGSPALTRAGFRKHVLWYSVTPEPGSDDFAETVR